MYHVGSERNNLICHENLLIKVQRRGHIWDRQKSAKHWLVQTDSTNACNRRIFVRSRATIAMYETHPFFSTYLRIFSTTSRPRPNQVHHDIARMIANFGGHCKPLIRTNGAPKTNPCSVSMSFLTSPISQPSSLQSP